MDEQLEQAFIREIERQCEYALVAYALMMEAIDISMTPGIFCRVQSFLVAAANVSKIFDPAPKGSQPFKDACEKRGEHLQAKFAIGATSLILNRDLRDRFEHSDEDIEKWWSDGHTGIVDGNVSDSAALSDLIGTDAGNMCRNFVVSPPTVVLGSREYLLEPLMVAIRAVMAQARGFLGREDADPDLVFWRSSSPDIRVG